jgi:flagellar hook-basal body complex protein FliE
MNVGAIGTNGARLVAALQERAQATRGTAKPEGQGFGQLIGNAIQPLNQIHKSADAAAWQVATGEGGDLHNALITIEEASLAFQLALQVRNKVVEAYQEVMRMQV